jgi:hypothetical protein
VLKKIARRTRSPDADVDLLVDFALWMGKDEEGALRQLVEAVHQRVLEEV